MLFPRHLSSFSSLLHRILLTVALWKFPRDAKCTMKVRNMKSILDHIVTLAIVELAVVIGKDGRDYQPSQAMDHVAGNEKMFGDVGVVA